MRSGGVVRTSMSGAVWHAHISMWGSTVYPLLGCDGYGGGSYPTAVEVVDLLLPWRMEPILLAGSTLGTAVWTFLRMPVCGGRGP